MPGTILEIKRETEKEVREQDSMEKQRESHMQQRKKRRVVLFPLPLQGHINPMLQLANILYDKGLSITVIHTNFNSPNTCNYPHFDFCSIPAGLLEGGASTSDVIALIELLNVNCVVPFRDCLAKLLSNVEEESIACLITDTVYHFTQTVADSLKLPWIVLRTSSISSFLAFAATSLLHEKGYFPIQGFVSTGFVLRNRKPNRGQGRYLNKWV
ncbi:hypothetical protein Pint_06400 [Pistacia integerrima]|uniref:Uncharacterized protein n=1 Tax=Pistacia integerrima TaxID=434235 RepID=A0ACC0ZAH3_9ROSI|nr:hypothetical protein Pint_06400 [Pistacia integerrima]